MPRYKVMPTKKVPPMPKATKAEELKLIVGHCYSAKRPKSYGLIFSPVFGDRQILRLGLDGVQYDSPSVKNGRHYPIVTHKAFLSWAKEDVTDKMPADDWRPVK